MSTKISEDILYVGVDDHDLDLFESQYIIPNGMAYNSYVIMDEKIAVMDSVDARKTDEWMKNIEGALGGRKADFLVISHMEPDHSGSIGAFATAYPDAKLVCTGKAATMLSQFTDEDYSGRVREVKEGDTLSLGKHELTFYAAPMVHWPEVMVSYDSADKVLFSADAFGKFGTLDTDEDWACEARRYYFNIVGKYGAQAQALLKKAAALDIEKICPLHGPILPDAEPLDYYIGKYDIWSKYEPEDDGVFIAFTSIHGNTAKAVERLAKILEEKGAKKVSVADLSREDVAEAIEDSFRYDKLVVASATYDAGLFPVMENYLYRLGHKNFRNRRVAIVENGSWAPAAAKKIREAFEGMKDITICENMVSIKSSLKESDIPALEALADELLAK